MKNKDKNSPKKFGDFLHLHDKKGKIVYNKNIKEEIMKKRNNFFKAAAVMLCLGSTLSLAGCKKADYDDYDNAQKYSIGDFEYQAADVKKVEVHWETGAIEVIQSSEDSLSVAETQPAETDAEKMHYYLDGTTLKIRFCASDYDKKINSKNKNLKVEVPENVALDIESEDADITLKLLEGRGAKIVFETDRGKFRTEKEYGKVGERYDIFAANGVSGEWLVEIETETADLIVE